MEQRSEEWFAARKGRVTASMVGAILGVSPNLSRAGAMRRMVRDAHGAEPEFTGNIATQYGENNEAGAIAEYQMETGRTVNPVGFVTREDWAGCSPDGLIGDDGGLEVKCPFGKRKEGDLKPLDDQPHYYAQVQFSLWVTGRASNDTDPRPARSGMAGRKPAEAAAIPCRVSGRGPSPAP